MKSIAYILIFAGCTSFSCNKVKENISGIFEVRGTVYIIDTLNGIFGEKLLTNQRVELKSKDQDTTANFIYSSNTNSQGGFTFTNLMAKEYVIFSQKDTNNLHFKASMPISPVANAMNPDFTINVKVVLFPDTINNNILYIVAKDSTSGGFLNDTRICLFSSKLLANANGCAGSFSQLATNTYGKTHAINLQNGWIYINARDSTGKIDVSGKDSVFIQSNKKFYPVTILLK